MKRTNVHKNEQAFVAIFSVLIIMSILTLIAIGFSNITRRAQQRVLNGQLNVQAYYAAESGVNDAIAAIKLNPALTKTTCQAAADGFSYNNNLDNNLNVGYTCILINNQDPKLVFNNVPIEGTSTAQTTDFKLSTGQPVKTFDVIWSAHTNSAATTISNTTTLTPVGAWGNNLGLVRMDLAPIDQGLDRAALATKVYSYYLYASQVAASPNGFALNGVTDQNGLIFIKCTTTTCTAHMTLGSPVASAFKMRLQSVYAPVDVTIANGVDVNGNSGSWVGGQDVIDVTGKANDVFRRIQVRIPLTTNGATASYGLQSADSICKRLAALSGATTTDSSDNSCQAN
jgi:Tfp pilus assembly protein PilX